MILCRDPLPCAIWNLSCITYHSLRIPYVQRNTNRNANRNANRNTNRNTNDDTGNTAIFPH